MKQSRENEIFDLDRDLPTTREDINALRKIKLRGFRSSDEYVRFLMELSNLSPGACRSRRSIGFWGNAVFEL